ncbi:VOC family protein [Streptomyces sp. NPDC058305]|uniref:VOC family protein n=1 Tax=Streptomyces sp. NPDC058305 TaxID=3346438 RepID=UPI0036EA12D8
MLRTPPSLITEEAALSVAGAGLLRYAMGPPLIGAGTDATVVIVEPGDNPKVSGVQDSVWVLLRGDRIPELHSRFEFRGALPIHVFARMEAGCLPLGTAHCRAMPSVPANFNRAELRLIQPLTRDTLIHENQDSAVVKFDNLMIKLLDAAKAPELITPSAVGGAGNDPRNLLTIEVTDANAVVTELEQHGVRLLNGPVDRPWGRRTAAFADPAGNVWGTSPASPPSP